LTYERTLEARFARDRREMDPVVVRTIDMLIDRWLEHADNLISQALTGLAPVRAREILYALAAAGLVEVVVTADVDADPPTAGMGVTPLASASEIAATILAGTRPH
jgi:hypothetical protein